jgi:hypothetical protein
MPILIIMRKFEVDTPYILVSGQKYANQFDLIHKMPEK